MSILRSLAHPKNPPCEAARCSGDVHAIALRAMKEGWSFSAEQPRQVDALVDAAEEPTIRIAPDRVSVCDLGSSQKSWPPRQKVLRTLKLPYLHGSHSRWS